ncbi:MULTISPECIES: class II fructose-bisphosphate aldolase [Lacrimispora]|jgi:fructose-bisphosphate aldolase class II|uniref:class II fructose-bisphosphate aldolase n=1 Tax=Lacrimispora TaxID=2719231 RepID=UPI000BE42BA4|nr:class II fructose-bisphosphate aldolase [Lacrimispora amygdalina]MDK2964864.1 fructose-bisphosphate aldolase, class [Lacrimispora sp.]
MLVSMKAILEDANKHYYGVMAMNSINIEMARAGILAAEEEHSPIIIQFGPGQMKKHAHAEDMLPVIKELAERVYVPVALNLDHGTDFYVIADCINRGFTNVMFDGSALSFQENIKRTSVITALAHQKGCSVEGELGHVGQAVNSDDTDRDLYTNPDLAVEFVKKTGIDALAVAIGTAHGAYPKGKIPKLDFERLIQLKSALNMPLVLHGGSGSGEENLRKAIAGGINKINVCTDAFEAGKQAMLAVLKEDSSLDYMNLCMAAEAGIKSFVKDYMRIIGSAGRYCYGETLASGNE